MLNQFPAIMKAFVGGVAEWSNAPVLKTDEGESPPRVRIPVPPPHTLANVLQNKYLYFVDSFGPPIGPTIRFIKCSELMDDYSCRLIHVAWL